ncbi:TPA: hypothetical protein CPT82_04765 [Candidatus Gastranaerophilales bacterium HUM_2]|jgi:phospholipase, patatin family|nr:MAG TPA: hypothetical protein CPT82_04765 [Candidatus Gastranaerophilales bacterium HUM_2]
MDNNFKYTCLFGGGAIRGVSYIGAVKALEELGIIPDRLAGSSVGSIFAALLAVGYNAEELKDIFIKVNFELFKDISIGLGPLFAISKGEVFLEWVRELIEKKYYGENYKKGVNPAVTFKDIKKNLVVITTNLSNFECKEFSKFDTPDYEIASAVRISCCMPGLMKPIEYNKTLLVDGDLQKSWPMWKLSKHLLNDDERILEFRLEGNYESNDISGINYANAVYSCMTAISTSFITNIYGNKDKFDYIVLNTGDIVVVDFNINEAKRNDLINSGYNQTISYFKDFLIEKKSKIRHNYSIIQAHITKIQKYIKSNNIQKAKNQMGELFMDLPELSEIIDLTDYNEIKKFRDIFLKNLKYPALFGKVTLSNFKLIDTELNKINNKISKKLEEFDSYLKTYQKK